MATDPYAEIAARIDAADSPMRPNVGAPLLDDVHAFLGMFVSYPSPAAHDAHTLWVAHAHNMGAWDSTPRLAFLSPEPGSGKSRALEITELLVPRPVLTVNATPAFVFRRVADEAGLPTLLADEIDATFGPKARDNEELRAFYNAGHRRGAVAGRCVVKGKTVETEELEAFCAVALAGLGDLPDTILTRSIIIKMKRRAPGEHVEPFRRRVHAAAGEALRDRLAEWADDVEARLKSSWPDMPPGIVDRAADVWEPILATADEAGGHWPERARVAAVTLVTDAMGREPSLGVRLLGDIRDVLGGEDQVPTETLLQKLHDIDEAPWADLRGKALDARGLSRRLRVYGITPRTIRTVAGTAKGYRREDLHDAWVRYLTNTPVGVSGEIASANVTSASLGLPPMEGVTSVTSATACPRCDGDGCQWCAS